MASRAVVHPLDTLRVLQSVSSSPASSTVVRESATEAPLVQRLTAASGHFLSTAQKALGDGRSTLRTAWHNWHLGPSEANPLYDTRQLRDSFRILYRGYGLSVFGAQPVFGLYFGAYEAAKRQLAELLPQTYAWNPSLVFVAAGFLAECCAVLLWNPWEVVRQRMQLSASSLALETANDVVKESGVRGLYAGVGGYLVLWGTYSPLMFVMYEQGVSTFYGSGEGGAPAPRPSLGGSFLIGSLSGFVASTLTSPLDVVKTRMQTQTPTSITRYDNVYEGLMEIYSSEGPRALFRGTMARSLNNGLAAGIMFGSYSVLSSFAARHLGWLPDPQAPTASAQWRRNATQSAAAAAAEEASPPDGAAAAQAAQPAQPRAWAQQRASQHGLQSWNTRNTRDDAGGSYDEGMWPGIAQLDPFQRRAAESGGTSRQPTTPPPPPQPPQAPGQTTAAATPGTATAGAAAKAPDGSEAPPSSSSSRKPPPADPGWIKPFWGSW